MGASRGDAMRVCVVAEHYPRRRDPVLGVWAHRQALAAREAGAEVRVLVLERPVPPVSALRAARGGDLRPLARTLRAYAAQPRHEELDGLSVEYVRFLAPPRERGYGQWHAWAARPLARALERLHTAWPFDLVHAHYALPAGGATRPWCARRGVPLVTSVHGGDVLGAQLTTPPARAAVAAVLRASAGVLANSAATLDRAAALAGSSEGMTVVHLGADARTAPKRPAPTVATLGHLIPRKRHADVLRALHAISERRPDLRWLVIGDGPTAPEIRRLAGGLGMADRVDLAGQLPHERALEALASCELMALPSVDEAFGVAYVEAMACGVPAIGCRGEGGPDEIAALGPGLTLVEPGDVAGLAEVIEGLLQDPHTLAETARAARRTATEHFGWERCGHETVAAYARAVAP